MQVITKQVEGHKCEPYEEAVIEVPEEHVGPVVDMLGQRKGQMLDLVAGDNGGLTRSHPSYVTCTMMKLLECNSFTCDWVLYLYRNLCACQAKLLHALQQTCRPRHFKRFVFVAGTASLGTCLN